MDRFRELSAFVAVVEQGSFVAAAEALQVTKAAVSRAVLDLEVRLGARLLQRTTRRMSLTDEGRAYHERARQILEELDEADQIAGLGRSQPAGRLRVNAPQSFGVRHLAPIWGPFLRAFPEIELEVTLTDRQVDLIDEGIDVAVRISRLTDSSLIARRIAVSRMVMCASPRYLARRGTPRSADELRGHDVLAYTYWSGGDVWRFEAEPGPVEVLTRPRLRANNGDTCVAAALDDQGIIFQPTFLIAGDLAAGRLVELLPALRGPKLEIHAIYPTRRQLAAKVRVLVDFLVSRFHDVRW